jgi:hypothetical protein
VGTVKQQSLAEGGIVACSLEQVGVLALDGAENDAFAAEEGFARHGRRSVPPLKWLPARS